MAFLDTLVRPVDAMLLTGDVADHGLATEYEEARALLDRDYPVLACPGNPRRTCPVQAKSSRSASFRRSGQRWARLVGTRTLQALSLVLRRSASSLRRERYT
jgi:3',5'-cyclic-AMP phosphodiesterase